MFICPYCKKSYDRLISLSIHCRKSHKKTSKQFYVDYNLNGVKPTCKCGCGEEVKYLDISRGFRKYIRGHAARIPGKNNFQKNGGFEKSLYTRRKMFASGKLIIWSKGLTKETDERVASYVRKSLESVKNNKKELERRSTLMRKNRLNGTIPTLHGPKHSQWKDGTSTLHQYCHSNFKLRNEWKNCLLKKQCYTCEHCNEKFDRKKLHVHHDKEKMCDIIRKIAFKFGWRETIHDHGLKHGFETLKTDISNAVAQYHIDNNVSGVVLCKKCHKKEHAHLNFKNCD